MLQHIDIGHRIAVEVAGDRDPVVVFVSGVQDDRTVWAEVRNHLRSPTTTLTYDRPGLGDSDPLPATDAASTHGTLHSATELEAILSAMNAPSQRVLVGHSIGAHIALTLASTTPELCSGLALVDPSDPTLFTDIAGFDPLVTDADHGTCFDWRKINEDYLSNTPPAVPTVIVASAVGRWLRTPDPEHYLPFTLAEIDARWQRWQTHMAQQVQGELVIAPEAGHRVHIEDPALVAAAIDGLVSRITADHSGVSLQ